MNQYIPNELSSYRLLIIPDDDPDKSVPYVFNTTQVLDWDYKRKFIFSHEQDPFKESILNFLLRKYGIVFPEKITIITILNNSSYDTDSNGQKFTKGHIYWEYYYKVDWSSINPVFME